MPDFFEYDPTAYSVKGLVFVGSKLVIYRRDKNTDHYPLHLDLPGGRLEKGETPFQAFQREVKEEFSLDIAEQDIIYFETYVSRQSDTLTEYFPVAKLPHASTGVIKLGDEGISCHLISINEFFDNPEIWDGFKERLRRYQVASA